MSVFTNNARSFNNRLGQVMASGALLMSLGASGLAMAGSGDLAAPPASVEEASTLSIGLKDTRSSSLASQDIRFQLVDGRSGDHSKWLDLSTPTGSARAMIPVDDVTFNYERIVLDGGKEIADQLVFEIEGEDEECGTTFEYDGRTREGHAIYSPIDDLVFEGLDDAEGGCSSCTTHCTTITFFGADHSWAQELGPTDSASDCIDAGVAACGVPWSFHDSTTCTP